MWARAYLDGEEVGRLVSFPDPTPLRDGRRFARVDGISVNKNVRRRGIGTALYEATAAWWAKQGIYLASDMVRQPAAEEFWLKQVRKGRADYFGKPGAKNDYYVLREAPPRTLENPHTHPQIAVPITARQFRREFEAVFARSGLARATLVVQDGSSRCNPGSVPTEPDPDLRREHARTERRYATVDLGARPIKFMFAPQVLALPRANRLGLIRHEIGHALLRNVPGHSEADADEVARARLGPVGYDPRWLGGRGRGLQRGR